MYYGARGIVGLVKPTYRPGSMESFIKLMPEGVGFIPFHAGIRAGNEQEFQEALLVAEKKVARLAELGADVVMIMGAPPAMVRGHGADRQISDQLSKKYGIPVLVATMAQADAFRALGLKKLVGITYFQEELNRKFAKFFEDDGFGREYRLRVFEDNDAGIAKSFELRAHGPGPTNSTAAMYWLDP